MRERSSPDAGVRVKPLMTRPAINTDASKYGKEQISCTVQEMFEEADCGWFQITRLSKTRYFFHSSKSAVPALSLRLAQGFLSSPP